MVSIICGTNREGSNSLIFSKAIAKILSEMEQENCLLDLNDLPHDYLFNNEVFAGKENPLEGVYNKHVSAADKFIFVIPEYNGSFPGALKGFIDSFAPARIHGKKALLIGISSGRAGNLRGLEHFTGVLNYLKVHVHPFKPSVAHCHTLIEEGEIHDDKTMSLLKASIGEFL